MAEKLAVTSDDKRVQTEAVGDLCDWLQANGFKVHTNHLAPPENDCKWLAWRSLSDARDCECNDKPPSLIVTPHLFTMRDRQYASVEVSITGQQSDWFNLKAYSIGLDEVRKALPRLESALTRAWNALGASGVKEVPDAQA